MMVQYLQVFAAGLFISLAGSLPLGTLNVTAMQIAARENTNNALRYGLGVTVVEMGYIMLTLTIIGSLTNQSALFFVFQIVSVVVLTIMAVASFMAIFNQNNKKNVIIDNNMNRWLLGASMSLVNPMQVPFWMGWIIYLLSQHIIVNSLAGNVVFTLGAGMGTFAALLVFILAGRRFSAVMLRNERTVNFLMGSLFLVMAIFQLVKLL